MSFRLVYGDHELPLDLPLEAHVESRLYKLIEAAHVTSPERVRAEIAARIADAVSSLLEGAVIPPTEKQIKYAVSIAQELSLELPAQVLQQRDAMAAFLGRHADTYRRRKGYSPSSQG